MRAIVLVNPNSGTTAPDASALAAALQAAGVSAQVRALPGHELADAASRAAQEEDVDAIVAAGGDGTVSAVAGALAGADVPMAVLPTGTLNHFARDLGIPSALPQAAGIIAAGHVTRVDLGELNGRIFINNASIGLYPHIVRQRDQVRQRLGHGKWRAMLHAAVAVFRRYPTVRVRLGVGDASQLSTTPFVFVGNNAYEISLTLLGRRQRLDAGELSVYFAHRTGRFALLRLALRAVLGRLEQARDFGALRTRELWIETAGRSLRVAVDGEVMVMAPPLHFTSRPRALKVIAPAPAEPDDR